jgi:hypothetical protein
MIDRHYGHLARDGREHAIRLLDGYKPPRRSTSTPWTLGGHQTTPATLALATQREAEQAED